MKIQLAAFATATAIVGAFIVAPVSAMTSESNSNSESSTLVAQRPSNSLLQNRDVTGVLEDGSTFTGTVTITSFAYDDENRNLVASGVLEGTAVSDDGLEQQITQEFDNVGASLSESSSKQVCDILFLDLGPIFLDVLGLTVDLSEIELDINAVSGSGNLLGNLLCQLVSLFDGGSLSLINNLLNQINNILG